MNRAFTLLELLIVVATIAVLAAIAVPNFLEAQTRAKTARVRQDQASLVVGIRAYYTDHRRYPPNNPDAAAFFRACTAVDMETSPGSLSRRPPGSSGDPFAPVRAQPTSGGFFLPTPEGAGIPWMGRPPGAQQNPPTNEDEFARPSGTVYPKWTRQMARYGGFMETFPVEGWPAFSSTMTDLQTITTPLAYYGMALPLDSFGVSRSEGYRYVNLAEAWRGAPANKSGFANPRFLVLSPGPDYDLDGSDNTQPNPSRRPLSYDPTNGTVSTGDLFHGGE